MCVRERETPIYLSSSSSTFSLEDLDAKVRERYSGSKKQREGEGGHHPTEITFTVSPRDSPVAKVLMAGDAHSHNDEEDGSNRGSIR